MAKKQLNLSEFNIYMTRLLSLSPALVDYLMSLINNKKEYLLKEEIATLFYKKPVLQKILWSNGLRIMAIEEDLKKIHKERAL